MTVKTREVRLKCPFCGNAELTVIDVPVFLSFKKGPYGGGKSGISRSAAQTIVQEEKCPSCGKSKRELEKAFETGETKEYTMEDHKKRLDRMRAMGLPTRIVNKRD